MEIIKYDNKYAEEVIKIIKRNLLEINIKDYSKEEMVELANTFTTERINNFNKKAHFYIVVENEIVIGCGGIQPYWDSENESILRTIFVLPERHGEKIGSLIMNTLEKDEYYIRAKRIEIPSSITSVDFYLKFGYKFKGGNKHLDESNHYKLEKFK